MSGQTVQGQTVPHGLDCLPFHLHLLHTLFYGKITLFKCKDNYGNFFGV